MNRRNAPKFSGRFFQILSILVIISSLLTSCRLPWQAAPAESTPTPEGSGAKAAGYTRT